VIERESEARPRPTTMWLPMRIPANVNAEIAAS